MWVGQHELIEARNSRESQLRPHLVVERPPPTLVQTVSLAGRTVSLFNSNRTDFILCNVGPGPAIDIELSFTRASVRLGSTQVDAPGPNTRTDQGCNFWPSAVEPFPYGQTADVSLTYRDVFDNSYSSDGLWELRE